MIVERTPDLQAWIDEQLAAAPPLSESAARRVSVALFGTTATAVTRVRAAA